MRGRRRSTLDYVGIRLGGGGARGEGGAPWGGHASMAKFSTNCLPIWLKFSQCGQCSMCDRYSRCITSHVTSHITNVTNH